MSRNSYNGGVVSAQEVTLNLTNNNEHGVTEASTRMVFDIKNHYVAKGAKFRSTGQTLGRISGKMIAHGQQDLRNGYLEHDGTTEFGTTADTTLKNMTLNLKHELDLQGKVHLDLVYAANEKGIIFKSTSINYTNNGIFKAPSVYREDGSVINLENKLLFAADDVGSGLNSTLNGTPDSLFGIRSKTLDELGSHAVGDGVFNIADLSPEASHRLAYGLGEYQNKTYAQSVYVATERAEPITYTPSARADGAVATLLTKGVVALPPEYGRARGLTLNTYREAERFVAGYDGYDLPDIQLPKKNFIDKFYESANEAANVAFEAGVKSASIPGAIVAAVAAPVSWITGHKARKIARGKNAAIETETMRRANIQRDIDNRQLALDERAELAELYNVYNDARFDELYHGLGGYSNLGAGNNSFTMQDLLQYWQDIAAGYDSLRLESQQQHSNYAKEIAKHFSGQREQIRKLGGMKVHGGVASNFGADGYTVSATYGAGFNGNMSYGRVPIYDKIYTRPSPSQQPVEIASGREHAYQWPDLPPITYEDLVLSTTDGGLSGTRYHDLGSADVTEDVCGAIDEFYNNDYLTAPGFKSGINNIETSNSLDLDRGHPQPVENTEKSFGRKLQDFWIDFSNDVDESQTDFYDVKSTRELNEGRAAIVRGFGSGAANAIQPVLHPVDAVTDLVVTTWDGMNELSNLAFGVVNQASLQRGQVRGRQTVDAIYMFKEASANEKLKIGSEFVGTMLFGYGVGVGGGFGLNKAISDFDRYIRAPVVPYAHGNQYLSLFSRHKEACSSLGKQIAGDVSVIPRHKFDLWYNYLTKRGVKFEIGSSKAMKELAQSNADGLFEFNLVCRETNFFERTIYLSENFRARVFYEEVLHALDSIKGRPRFMNVEGVDINAFEYRAKNILINSSGKRGFSYDDFITLENHLEMVMKNTY